MQLTATDVKIEGDEMTVRLVPSRLPASLLASAALHALAFLVAIRFLGSIAQPDALPRAEIIPVALVSLSGGGGGATGNGTPAPPPAPVAAPAPAVPAAPTKPVMRDATAKKRPPVTPRARPTPPPAAAAAATAPKAGTAGVPSAASGSGSGRGAPGGGDGSGGDGSGGAVAYGTNPRPPYPPPAKRLGIEGRVLLHVVVRPDGGVATVTVRQSSGYRMLDDSALETVRRRWRFIPERRDGVPVESSVVVPIRFHLSEG